MNKFQRSQAFLRKRKMMMVLPLLVIPFLTMAFWALGGGTAQKNKITQSQPQGLNLQLPNANLKDDQMADKMSLYDQADKDSIKLAELMRIDPYLHSQDSMQKPYSNELEQITKNSAHQFNQASILQNPGLKASPYDRTNSPAEEKVMKKLAELNNVINQQEQNGLTDKTNQEKDEYSTGDDINRLENMMQVMNQKNENDPEIKQLENTLDKILDIQHPDRVKNRIKEKSLKNKEAVFPISKASKRQSISLLDTAKKKADTGSGFFGLDDQPAFSEENNAVEAVVHENQILVNGAVVKLRLTNDVFINGSLISGESFVYGVASLNNERLEIEINSIRSSTSLYAVKLEVYDMDGLPGIHIPGAITRDVAKQSADNSLQLMELSTMDPSLKAQAAAAGISAAKSLLSRKVKQVKVMVKAGYKVLLKDKNIQQ